MASVLETIQQSFQTEKDAEKPPIKEPWIVWQLPELSGTLVVIVTDKMRGEKAKKEFCGHSIWSEEEFVWFMSQLFDFDEEAKKLTAKKDIEETKKHFIATCIVKAAFSGMITRKDFGNDRT